LLKPNSTDRSYAHQLEEKDELSAYRSAFVSNEPDLIYLNGNSLGRLPKTAVERVRVVTEEEWGIGLIRSWKEGWYELPTTLGAKISHLIGAEPDEVLLSDSTTVNLYKLVSGVLECAQKRSGIITDELNFPSNLYILQTAAARSKREINIRTVHSRDGISISPADLEKALDENTALLHLSHVSYKSGFLHDMARLTQAARDRGVYTLWDLSHSVGTVPIRLNDCQVDLAVGCTYKYLNGGPGAPAFLFVSKRLQEVIDNPIWGWFGAERPFAFAPDFSPSEGIRRYLVGTPPILSLSALEPAIDITLEAQVERIRKKSVELTEYLFYLAEEWLIPLGFSPASPRDPERRGSHVTLRHREGYRISLALMDARVGGPPVITDFREPDNIRLGVAALYNSFTDIHAAIAKLRLVVEKKLYENQSPVKEDVT
jgi:kynureninase